MSRLDNSLDNSLPIEVGLVVGPALRIAYMSSPLNKPDFEHQVISQAG